MGGSGMIGGGGGGGFDPLNTEGDSVGDVDTPQDDWGDYGRYTS